MSDESLWRKILRATAPVVGTAIGGPLGGAAASVVSEKLLGKPDGTETEIAQAIGNGGPEVLAKLKEAELAFTTRMRELDIDVEKIHQADRAAAREREAKTGDTFTPRALALFVTSGFFGVLGPKTLAAVNALNADSLRSKILAQRLRFMSSLPNWPAFSRGWSRRIADLMEA